MAKLMNHTQGNKILIDDLRVASNMMSRMKGLLGTKDLGPSQGLWIHRCNSIHTFFMSYAIDCIFVDQNLTVQALVKNVKPGRMVLPIWKSKSVIELKTGQIEKLGLALGDQLHVGH